jgi:hypothetical protein
MIAYRLLRLTLGPAMERLPTALEMFRLSSGEWHMDLVAIAFYLFVIHRFIVSRFINLYDVAI